MGVESDFSEIDRLAADLGTVANNAADKVEKALGVTSGKIKKDWQEPLKGSKTLPALPYAITYDIDRIAALGATVTVFRSEIGFDKDRNQGPLGNVSEFGTPTVAPRGFGLAALQKNQDDFEKGLTIATQQAEREAGL